MIFSLLQSIVHALMASLDTFLHLDVHLREWVVVCGAWIYPVLFLIIFCETGLVVTPFLPGDSLLFAAGALAALDPAGVLTPTRLVVLLALAGIFGNTVNYWIGRTWGLRFFARVEGRIVKHEYLERTQIFYARHGGKAIVLARFIPIIRTIAPFVAGVGLMDWRRYLLYNVSGSLAWVGLMILAGFFFGTIPAVQHNFHIVVVAIIAVSLLPVLYTSITNSSRAKRTRGP